MEEEEVAAAAGSDPPPPLKRHKVHECKRCHKPLHSETCHDHCYGSWYCCNVQNDVSVKEWKAEQKRRREEPRGELKMHTSNSSSLPIGPTAAVHSTSSDFPEMKC